MSTSNEASVQADVDRVRSCMKTYSNWGRWGAVGSTEDRLGALNHIKPEDIAAAASTVRDGKVFPLGIPVDSSGPMTGMMGRFNPIHLMIRDGGDITTGAIIDDFYGGVDTHFHGADDVIIMPLQSVTQWDAMAHATFEGFMYNGVPAKEITSKGARFGDIRPVSGRTVGRGVLLDIARAKGVPSLEPGYAITAEDLVECEEYQGVQVRRGDMVLIRTGQLGECQRAGSWANFIGPCAGLGFESVPWVAEREVSALATDTWAVEVVPYQTSVVTTPMHAIFIVAMGITLGEIFVLDDLADDCAADGRYEFLLAAPALPVTGGTGSPINPMALK